MWGFTHKTYVEKIFLLQEKIVRATIFASKTDHSDPIFPNLEFLNIDGIRQCSCFLLFMIAKIN